MTFMSIMALWAVSIANLFETINWVRSMKLPVNHFKKRLLAGETQFGLWLGLPDTSAAEICAGAGFDWLLIDAEHAPFDVPGVMAHLQAIEPYDCSSIVRPPIGDRVLIKQLLDVGAQTLLIPMVETAEQAAELVQSVNYPPKGVRGLGTSLARAARWNSVPDYLHQANDQICLMVQIETVSALGNLDEILKVDGIDAVFIGPSDLSASMGYIGNAGHPEVVAAIEEAIVKITAAGKAAGLLAMIPEMVQAYIDKGATFVGVGVDTLCLSNAAKQLANKFSGKEDSKTVEPQAGY